jgi:predicted RND superfamily exporter protein
LHERHITPEQNAKMKHERKQKKNKTKSKSKSNLTTQSDFLEPDPNLGVPPQLDIGSREILKAKVKEYELGSNSEDSGDKNETPKNAAEAQSTPSIKSGPDVKAIEKSVVEESMKETEKESKEAEEKEIPKTSTPVKESMKKNSPLKKKLRRKTTKKTKNAASSETIKEETAENSEAVVEKIHKQIEEDIKYAESESTREIKATVIVVESESKNVEKVEEGTSSASKWLKCESWKKELKNYFFIFIIIAILVCFVIFNYFVYNVSGLLFELSNQFFI